MTQTPASTDGGQAPTGGLPQAGTPTTDGQAPVSQTAPTEHERIITELRKENAAARKRIETFEALQKEAELAKLGETEKLQKQNADLQERQEALAAELFEARVHQEVGRLASKFNFLISADTLARMLLLDDDAIEFEGSKPTNIEKLLEKLAKAEPELVKPLPAAPGTPGNPALPAMNPGRSSIQSPGATTPGRIPSLTDPSIWKR